MNESVAKLRAWTLNIDGSGCDVISIRTGSVSKTGDKQRREGQRRKKEEECVQ